MSNFKRIFIVGQPGAGKALLAKTVAKALDWRFIDADLGLESRIGCPMNTILGSQGQQAFNDCQNEILQSLCDQEHIVVTTDASVVDAKSNCQLLLNELTVFLDVSLATQMTRTARSFDTLLPLTSLEDFFAELHEKRDESYKKIAKLIIHSNKGNLQEHADSVVQFIGLSESEKSTKETKGLILFHKELHTTIHLPPQQALILKLLAEEGKTAKEIARETNNSFRTIEGTLAKIMESLGCSSSKELIALYHDQP